MKDFIISTDSTADLPLSFIEENNIFIHPLHYTLNKKEYLADFSELFNDERSLSAKDFYRGMRNDKMPSTSATNPEFITKMMKEQIDKGFDILHISFSSALSSSYSNAALCAESIMEEVPGSRILVVDSLCATGGQGLMVYKAVQLKKEGKTIEEIAAWINENKQHFVLQFIVDDLFHLVRGGRLSKPAAVLGSVLHFKPLLQVNNDGKLYVIDKIRGRKKALKVLADNIKEKINGIEENTIFITHADCSNDAIFLADRIKRKYKIENIIITDLGPAIGAHTGADAVVVSYFGHER